MRKVIVGIVATLAAAGITYAAGFKCTSCNGTGWKGQFRCPACGGDGVFGN